MSPSRDWLTTTPVQTDQDVFERADLETYLWSQYAGVFDTRQMERHLADYVGFEVARQQVAEITLSAEPGSRVLDIGSGFGSFVLEARRAGYDATGVDIAEFEVDFARRRLKRQRPGDEAEQVYQVASGLALPFPSGAFDIVTLWNVLEHVDDYESLLVEAARILRTGGIAYVVCPNYAAFRDEAHYHVYWPSLVPRAIASRYLRLRGKDSRFFDSSIFYRTNWGVLRALRRAGLAVGDQRAAKLTDPTKAHDIRTRRILDVVRRFHLTVIVRVMLGVTFYNPFKSSVSLYARKRA